MIKYRCFYDLPELTYIVRVNECANADDVLMLARELFGESLTLDVPKSSLFIRFESGAALANVNGVYGAHGCPFNSPIVFISLNCRGKYYVYGNYCVTSDGEVCEA